MNREKSLAILILTCLMMSAYATTSTTQEAVGMATAPPSMAQQPQSQAIEVDVRPSRYSVLFHTLVVPQIVLETSDTLPAGFAKLLQTSLIQSIRNERLFTKVVTHTEGSEGVLRLRGTIKGWKETGTDGTITIHVGIADKISSCQFTESTAEGLITKSHPSGIYEIAPMIDGLTTFLVDFMHPASS